MRDSIRRDRRAICLIHNNAVRIELRENHAPAGGPALLLRCILLELQRHHDTSLCGRVDVGSAAGIRCGAHAIAGAHFDNVEIDETGAGAEHFDSRRSDNLAGE